MRRVLLLMAAVLLLAGCAARPVLRPVELRDRVLAHPDVGYWYTWHSAPKVLAGMSAEDALRWRRYRPDMTWDLVKGGYQVRLKARFGPEPRQMEALVDRHTGEVFAVKYK